jgi:hypothetical protein
MINGEYLGMGKTIKFEYGFIYISSVRFTIKLSRLTMNCGKTRGPD